MPGIVTSHLRPWPRAAMVLAIVMASLLIPRGTFAGPIEDDLQRALERLDTGDLQTGVLYDRVLPLSGIERFAGDGRAVASRNVWRQLYEELRRASADPGQRPPVGMLLERASRRQDVVPLAVVFDEYERIRPDAMERGAVEIRDGQLVRGNGEIFERRSAFAAAALREWTYRGTEVRFVLDRDDYFSNLGGAVPRLEADLDDGLGFRAMSFGVPLTARYADSGTKTLRLRATSADGTVAEAALAFSVRALAAPAPNDTLQVTGTTPYLGGVASGDAYVYLAPGRTQIQNPAVVVEGFDLENSMNWDELYALLNQESLIENLRADGYDAIVLNFTDATDYLQRNAFVVVDLIQQIRGIVGPETTMALAGASMGGLVSRYALATMEANGLPHSVRTFISFDVPHLGANIPLGIQYWVNFFSTQSADAAFFLSLLNRPAARQMLVYHYTVPPGSTGEPDPLRGTFASDLAAVGDWPSQPRLVAIANGSDNGTGQGFLPGAQIVQWSYSDLFVAVTGNIWAVPDGTSTRIFDGRIRILFSTTSQAVTVSGTQPYDNAPGGWRGSMADLDSVAAPYGDIVALHQSHCFIPTVSALAYDTNDLFHAVASDSTAVTNTPFDAIYSQDTNQEHVAITPQNAGWIRSEVGGAVTGIEPIAGAGVRMWKPWPNPSSDRVRIAFSLASPTEVDLRVFSVDGREVASLVRGVRNAGSHELAWSGRDSRGASAASGVYFVRFATKERVETHRVVLFR
ncbi:MAG TPA: FlgD immunoglobulin-like domain containing protein [Candidatus Eisenbacteria bacterium]|nr:FlgD immunoglobulin-like domain containing protein [Candidatus Eisenbacteria bacterium]